MKDTILEYIRERPGTIFGDLCSDIPGFSGELAMTDPNFPTVILWPSVSKEGVDALGGLITEKQVRMDGASQLSYFMAGYVSTLPIAKGFKKYKSDHWLPVCFSVAEKPAKLLSKKKTKMSLTRQ